MAMYQAEIYKKNEIFEWKMLVESSICFSRNKLFEFSIQEIMI